MQQTGTRCGGLTLDKFNNLFYVDADASQISKVKRADLLSKERPITGGSEATVKYDALESKTVKNVSDVAIEHEYLYWTNNSHMDGHGGVHKAFTEPFIKAQPF